MATIPGKAAGWADAGCGPHRTENKAAPRKTSRKTSSKTPGKNRAVEVRMRLPVGCGFARWCAVVALLQSRRHARPRQPERSICLQEPWLRRKLAPRIGACRLDRTPEAVPIVFARVDLPICRPEQGEPTITRAGGQGRRRNNYDGYPIFKPAYAR